MRVDTPVPGGIVAMPQSFVSSWQSRRRPLAGVTAQLLVVFASACGSRTALDDGTAGAPAKPDASDVVKHSDATTSEASAKSTVPDGGHEASAQTDASACITFGADLTCATNRDCSFGYVGVACSNECWPCLLGTPMNALTAAADEAAFNALPASSGPSECGPCAPTGGNVACVGGQCVVCSPGSPGCGYFSLPDAGADGSAGGDASLVSLDAAGELDAATPVDDAGSCTSPVVTFRLIASGGSWLVTGSDYSDTSATTWLTFYLPSGEQLYAEPTHALSLDCRSCSSMFPYGNGSWSLEVPDAGALDEWNGLGYVAGACGSFGAACITPLCMPPGPYIAKMCATDEGADAGLQCVEVPFEYPTTQTVTGMLP